MKVAGSFRAGCRRILDVRDHCDGKRDTLETAEEERRCVRLDNHVTGGIVSLVTKSPGSTAKRSISDQRDA